MPIQLPFPMFSAYSSPGSKVLTFHASEDYEFINLDCDEEVLILCAPINVADASKRKYFMLFNACSTSGMVVYENTSIKALLTEIAVDDGASHGFLGHRLETIKDFATPESWCMLISYLALEGIGYDLRGRIFLDNYDFEIGATLIAQATLLGETESCIDHDIPVGTHLKLIKIDYDIEKKAQFTGGRYYTVEAVDGSGVWPVWIPNDTQIRTFFTEA